MQKIRQITFHNNKKHLQKIMCNFLPQRLKSMCFEIHKISKSIEFSLIATIQLGKWQMINEIEIYFFNFLSTVYGPEPQKLVQIFRTFKIDDMYFFSISGSMLYFYLYTKNNSI